MVRRAPSRACAGPAGGTRFPQGWLPPPHPSNPGSTRCGSVASRAARPRRSAASTSAVRIRRSCSSAARSLRFSALSLPDAGRNSAARFGTGSWDNRRGTTVRLQRIVFDELNSKQKEIYNFQKVAALLADLWLQLHQAGRRLARRGFPRIPQRRRHNAQSATQIATQIVPRAARQADRYRCRDDAMAPVVFLDQGWRVQRPAAIEADARSALGACSYAVNTRPTAGPGGGAPVEP